MQSDVALDVFQGIDKLLKRNRILMYQGNHEEAVECSFKIIAVVLSRSYGFIISSLSLDKSTQINQYLIDKFGKNFLDLELGPKLRVFA